MRILEPIVLLLALSAALYKTKELWGLNTYKATWDDKGVVKLEGPSAVKGWKGGDVTGYQEAALDDYRRAQLVKSGATYLGVGISGAFQYGGKEAPGRTGENPIELR